MYSERIVEATLDDYARRNGWRPEFHTVAEVDEFCAYVDSLVNVDANSRNRYLSWKPGKRPSDARIEWIKHRVRNEQYCCFASAEYFATRYGRIRSADERIIHFEFRIGQRILMEIMAMCDDLHTAIQLFILKARQVGISTAVAVFFLHRILFRWSTYAVMASVQHDQSKKLADIIDTTWSKLPFWLPPAKTVLAQKEPRWANGSLLSIQAGSQEVGIMQGSSPSCVHISETGYYVNAKKVLDEGLFPACHQLPTLFMVLEGTGSLETLWQKETWEYSVKNQGKGARFRPIFIPPACATDFYPPESWLRMNPMPSDWPARAMDETRRMRRRGELYVRSTDYLWKMLGQRWEMSREFMWFWECGYKEALSKNSEREFLSQNAPAPEDAFQSKNTPVFTRETVEIVTKARKQVYKAYAVTGKTIFVGDQNVPYQPDSSDVDDMEFPIPLHWEAPDGNEYDWTLIPLKPFDDSTDEACFDKLLIYEVPEDDAEYSIAIDTAHGLNTPGEDRAHVSVHRDGKSLVPDRQVASFTSLRVNSPQMTRFAAAIAVLYGTDGAGKITSANPLIAKFVIEQVRKPGDECQHQLKIMGFLDHHIMHWYDSKGNIDPTKGNKEGWRTAPWSRPILLDRFVEAVVTGWLILNDPIVIRQLPHFVRKYKGEQGKPFMEHEEDWKDDNIFGAAMGWTTLHDMDNTAVRLARKFTPPPVEDQDESKDQWCTQAMILE